MINFKSLNDFKDYSKISDNKGSEISGIFKKIFEHYIYHDFEEKEVDILIGNLIESSKEINPTLIPYSEITNIIFTEYFNTDNETPFIGSFKSRFEKYIISKFSVKKSVELKIDQEYQNALLVIYKMIQHVELAISQKESLYQSLKDEIYQLNQDVYEASNKYNNMMSNFISILGIFAAIMMATFGAIQGFTSIFSNENNYSLTQIIIISCFGLFGLISILFLLLHSIAKLIDKDLSINTYPDTIFKRYPIYIHTLIFITSITVATLVHYFKLNPPSYMPDFLSKILWSLTFLVSILLIIIYFVHYFFSQNNGYYYLNVHINQYVSKFKNWIGLNKLLNGILIFIAAVGIFIFGILLVNILKPLF